MSDFGNDDWLPGEADVINEQREQNHRALALLRQDYKDLRAELAVERAAKEEARSKLVAELHKVARSVRYHGDEKARPRTATEDAEWLDKIADRLKHEPTLWVCLDCRTAHRTDPIGDCPKCKQETPE